MNIKSSRFCALVSVKKVIKMAQDSDYLALSIDDPFEVLGVSRDCDQRELKRKYQQLAREVSSVFVDTPYSLVNPCT